MTPKPWLASYRTYGISDAIDAAAHRSVVHMLEGAMASYAEKIAFRSFGRALTYSDVDRLSAAFAAWLQHELGVRKGDRIAVMAPNLLAFPIAFIGIARAGAVQVNVNPMYTARELEHQLEDSGCKVMGVYSGSTPTLAEIIDKTAITVAPGDGSGADLPGPPVDERLTATVSFQDVLQQGAGLQRQSVELGADDLLFLQYTGGTTGFSKGACLSHGNLVANTEQFKAFMPSAMRPGVEVIVTAIPLYHIFALMVNFITYFSIGAENWLVANPRDGDAFVDVMKAARPTVFMGVNTLYAGLATHPRIHEVDFSRLRLAGGGGAAVLGVTSDKWKAATGLFIREGYGLSETSPVVSFNPAAIEEFNGTTGLPVPGTDIQLLDDKGVEVGIGQPGEICIKGPQVMRGYWNQPEANAAAFTDDGYFRTGDVGQLDDRGFLSIVDRKKDMVIVSGFNVFPNEVEAVAAGCPGVRECACIGRPDEKTGEALELFIVRAPGSALTAEEVIAFCRKALTAYKVPKTVRFLEALPKSTVGKILRKDLRNIC